MKIRTLPNGNIGISLEPHEIDKVMVAFDNERAQDANWLQREATENWFIETFLMPLGYQQVKPEDVGALTSAPLIQPVISHEVYGFMDYAVVAFLEMLVKGEETIWTKS